ncbi:MULTISPECIES: hypothetical protein [Gordonia]|uniref:Uncharacterized protein n=1 Tax=Gordonia terrae TaxID=2055 RepID=A0A2I1R5F7_9ACTN|nr:hypothetical protein [Gordonia terrae]PKZ64366.1 hypothetical protein CYJ73_17360 [Gordonia terrae]
MSEIAAGRIAHLLHVPLSELVAAIRRGEIAGRVQGSTATVTESVSRLLVWASNRRSDEITDNTTN